MLYKINAIVLSKLKYGDNDLIVKCYTKQRGIASYLIKGALKSQKGSPKTAFFQPLSLLLVEEYYKPNRTFQGIKEVKLEYLYKTLHTDILKGAIVMFLSEVLSSVLKEEEPNESLCSYLENSMKWLDDKSEFSNFHLLFLLNLTKYLGFYPDTQNTNYEFFNLSSGLFECNKSGFYAVSGKNIMVLKTLLGINFDELNTINLNSKQRFSFLNMLMLYFELHLGDFKKPKSLEILNQVFN